MSTRTVWYISKYLALPGRDARGARAFWILQELARMGFTCWAVSSTPKHKHPTFRNKWEYTEQEGLMIYQVPVGAPGHSNSTRRVLTWIEFELKLLRIHKRISSKPEVVIVSSLSLLSVLNGIRLKRLFKCRLVFEVRDIWPLTLTEYGFSKSNPAIRFLAWVERFGYETADAIVGTMPNLGEHVKEILGYEKDVSCIPMGVHQALLESVADLSHERRTATTTSFTVAYAGSVGKHNALDTLFRCAQQMDSISNITFWIVGDGDLLEGYRQQYGSLKNLRFFGRLAHTDVIPLLRECDLLYLATSASRVWDFGQSLNKLIDYMLSGRPILASYSGYKSMINEAACGTFVPAEDVDALQNEILRYSSLSEEERDEIGSRGPQWLAENRDYRMLAERYGDLLSSLHS